MGVTVLYLGPPSPVMDYLTAWDCAVQQTEDRVLGIPDVDFIVSYGYRFKVEPSVIAAYRQRAINLHISLLPWNRGADPNLWSVIDETPKGVTVHYMDDGIDTGDVIAQVPYEPYPNDTLASSYRHLQTLVQRVSYGVLDALVLNRQIPGWPQAGPGSVHRSADKGEFIESLPLGWDTPLADVPDAYRRYRGLTR